jgi:hypothetical protein
MFTVIQLRYDTLYSDSSCYNATPPTLAICVEDVPDSLPQPAISIRERKVAVYMDMCRMPDS